MEALRVVVTVKIMNYASTPDRRPIEGEINYYGALIDIIQLDYSIRYKLVLFKCDWVDINKGCKKDSFGFTLVNFNHLKHMGNYVTDDPFVLASQVKKVFYVEDESHKDWLVVMHAKIRDMYDMGDELCVNTKQLVEQVVEDTFDVTHNQNEWIMN
uniref:DUF4216 domain-containing protein n=1 Tax=Nelumbo nucifera TaxID=4432 RepID=A0A822XRU2_NELNU|nr:TPA_asm: hypothetical protein HUJ06_024613 [Nelumbo nucifera]